ncbi:hypothetical protein [Nocardiopsis potens]|uniref:hypothetical protein n=1 Tax=Nocardiopsis potens TaxID=1246458 RepID=UPI0012682D8D|nr:hypothetical protein [Nocardiopsis potens]
MKNKIILYLASAIGIAFVIYLLFAPPIGMHIQVGEKSYTLDCDSPMLAGPPYKETGPWDYSNGIYNDTEALHNACDTRRIQQLSIALLVAIPTTITFSLALLRRSHAS